MDKNVVRETLTPTPIQKEVPLKNWMQFFWWLKSLVYLWVRSKSLPKKAKDFPWNPQKPVCYVFNSHSITDLMVLDHHCEKLKLPKPRISLESLTKQGEGAYIYLAKSGFVQKQR